METIYVVIESVYYSSGLEVESVLNAYRYKDMAEAFIERMQRANDRLSDIDDSVTDYTIKELQLF